MERIVTGEQAKAFDRTHIEAGASSSEWMRMAAEGVARASQTLADAKPIVSICGTGNNGGDGVAAAWLLKRAGADARIVLCGAEENCTPDTAAYLNRAREAGVPIMHDWMPQKDTVLIDALFGVGLNRPIEGAKRTLIERINQSGLPVVSADLPSGLDANCGRILGAAVRANVTVTMQAKKAGMLLGQGRTLCGEILVQPLADDPSIPQMFEVSEADVKALLPKRPFDSHKGQNGHALLCVGSATYPGAALLCARAALRGGAGLLSVCTPDPVRPFFSALPEAITIPTGTDDWCDAAKEPFLRAMPGKQAIGIGCGVGQGEIGAILDAALRSGTKLVLDADALNQMSTHRERLSLLHEKVVITPHVGEMARLLNTTVEAIQSDPLQAAAAYPCVTLLKGATTLVHATGRTAFLTFGNPGLAKGGSGDVLTGLITAMLAQGLDPFDAAVAGAYLLGASADRAVRLLAERMLLASDVIDMVSF